MRFPSGRRPWVSRAWTTLAARPIWSVLVAPARHVPRPLSVGAARNALLLPVPLRGSVARQGSAAPERAYRCAATRCRARRATRRPVARRSVRASRLALGRRPALSLSTASRVAVLVFPAPATPSAAQEPISVVPPGPLRRDNVAEPQVSYAPITISVAATHALCVTRRNRRSAPACRDRSWGGGNLVPSPLLRPQVTEYREG